MSDPEKLWDPFRGEALFEQETVAEPRNKSAKKPAFLTWGMLVALVVMVISGIGALIGKVLVEPWLMPCAIALAISVVVLLLFALGGDWLFGSGREAGVWWFSQVARSNSWSFKQVAPSVRSRTTPAQGAGPSDWKALTTSASWQSHDPEIEPAFKQLPELMEARPGRLIFPVAQAILRGRHSVVSGPALSFWMAPGLLESHLGLAAKELRKDSQGREHRHGFTLAALLAFDLETETGIRAACLAKSKREAQLGSPEGLFNISVRAKTSDLDDSQAEARFQQLLTPIREKLLDFEKRFHCQMILDGASVFFTFYELVPGSAEIESAINHALAEFAELAGEIRNSVFALS